MKQKGNTGTEFMYNVKNIIAYISYVKIIQLELLMQCWKIVPVELGTQHFSLLF